MPLPSDYPYTDVSATWGHSLVLPSIMKRLKGIPSEGSVLDIGCGNGALLAEIRKHGSWHLEGTETSESGVAMARSQGLTAHFCPLGLTSSTLPPEKKFDLLLSVEVIEHVFDPRQFLREAHGRVAPGGTLLLTTPYHGYLKNLGIAAAGKCDAHYNPLWDGGHVKFWSRKSITTVLDETGFSDIQFEGTGRLPYFWKSMVITATLKP